MGLFLIAPAIVKPIQFVDEFPITNCEIIRCQDCQKTITILVGLNIPIASGAISMFADFCCFQIPDVISQAQGS
jgi:hypothetical protein